MHGRGGSGDAGGNKPGLDAAYGETGSHAMAAGASDRRAVGRMPEGRSATTIIITIGGGTADAIRSTVAIV